MAFVPPDRHLLRAKDLADARFTTSFTRMFGRPPTAYRASFPPASAYAIVPACVVRAYGRPQRRTFREDRPGDSA
jgi:hypothetical protein